MSVRRLLIITNRYPTGPDDIASPFVYDFRKGLEKLGIQVDIVTPFYVTSRPDRRYVDQAVHIFPWSDGRRVISQLPLYHPASYLKMRRYVTNGYDTAAQLMQKNRYHALLALWALPAGYIASRLARRFDVPYAVWALGSDINSWAQKPLLGNLIVQVLRGAGQLYADGYELATKVQALADKPCRFIPSFHALCMEKRQITPAGKFFLFVGRIEKEKGIFDLLSAFRRFAAAHQDWQLEYVGTGRYEKKLEKQVAAWGSGRRVKIHGLLDRRTINHLMSHCTVFVIPSHADSLPLTFGEIMQAGRPVITSDIGDLPLFVDKYEVGYHYPAGDIGALQDCMERIIDKTELFSGNCPKVIRELDINNSAQAVGEWLDSVRKDSREKVYEHAGA